MYVVFPNSAPARDLFRNAERLLDCVRPPSFRGVVLFESGKTLEQPAHSSRYRPLRPIVFQSEKGRQDEAYALTVEWIPSGLLVFIETTRTLPRDLLLAYESAARKYGAGTFLLPHNRHPDSWAAWAEDLTSARAGWDAAPSGPGCREALSQSRCAARLLQVEAGLGPWVGVKSLGLSRLAFMAQRAQGAGQRTRDLLSQSISGKWRERAP